MWTHTGRLGPKKRPGSLVLGAVHQSAWPNLLRHEGTTSMRVAIVGGGIGGMTLALSLVNAGIHDVDIYESAPAIRELGVGINVLPHGVRELVELGLLDELLAVGIPMAEHVYY